MLKKSERLGRAAFNTYFKAGKRFHGTYTTVIVSPTPTFLAAVVVGKKVSKLAPKRNTLRRKIYAFLGKKHIETPLSGSYIIITKPAIARLSKQDFYTALETELGRALK